MKLTCFGKYGPYPKGGCATSCFMISTNGKNIIIDMGSGALSKILSKIEISDIHAVILSHLHSDHMGDMLTFRYALDVAKKMGMISGAIPVYLPKEPTTESGLIARHDLIDAKFINDGNKINLFGIDISFCLMPHSVPSYAMSFCKNGKKFVYSGDTKDNESLALFAKDADLFLMEAALLSKDKTRQARHVCAKDAGRIGNEANAKRMLITHIFPLYNENDLLAEAREDYKEAKIVEEFKIYEV